VTSFWRYFAEVNSRNLGGGHVCWGSYDSFNFPGWRGGCGLYSLGHALITWSLFFQFVAIPTFQKPPSNIHFHQYPCLCCIHCHCPHQALYNSCFSSKFILLVNSLLLSIKAFLVFSILLSMSSQYPFSDIKLPRYLNCSACSSLSIQIFNFVFLSLLITNKHHFCLFYIDLHTKYPCNFFQIIHELLQCLLTVGYYCFIICICDGIDHSVSRWYANICNALSMASLIIASSYNKYSAGDREHLCLTPVSMSMHWRGHFLFSRMLHFLSFQSTPIFHKISIICTQFTRSNHSDAFW